MREITIKSTIIAVTKIFGIKNIFAMYILDDKPFFLVFIRIRWIGTGPHPYKKTMSSIVLYPAFCDYKNVLS